MVLQEAMHYGPDAFLLLTNPLLVAAVFAPLNVLVKEARVTHFFEFGGDGSVGAAVVEHAVYLDADDLWKAGNFAPGTARRFNRWKRREQRLGRAGGGRRIDGFLDCWMIGWVDR